MYKTFLEKRLEFIKWRLEQHETGREEYHLDDETVSFLRAELKNIEQKINNSSKVL